jgi:23S rRNA maturation mini-RNase III
MKHEEQLRALAKEALTLEALTSSVYEQQDDFVSRGRWVKARKRARRLLPEYYR